MCDLTNFDDIDKKVSVIEVKTNIIEHEVAKFSRAIYGGNGKTGMLADVKLIKVQLGSVRDTLSRGIWLVGGLMLTIILTELFKLLFAS